MTKTDIIQVQYDELDTIAARFGHQAEATAALDARVRRGGAALEQGGWEGRGSAAFFAEMSGTLLPAMQRLTQVLNDASTATLDAKAIFARAEAEAAALFGGGAATGLAVGALAVAAGALAGGIASGAVGTEGSEPDNLLTHLAAGAKKVDYAAKVIEALSHNLTGIKPASIPWHMAKEGLKFKALGSFLAVLPHWIEDIDEYGQDGPTKLVSAMAVDAAIHVPTDMLISAAGGLLGGLAVTGAAAALGVTAPAIVVVGGGVVATIGLGIAAETVGGWVESKTHIREHAIEAVDHTLHEVGEGVSNAVHQVDNAFDSAIGALGAVHL